MWLVFASGIAEPLFYLLSLGVGLGALVGTVAGPGGQQVPYREFVAPGLLAVSALNGAMFDSTFNVFFRLKYAKLYESVLATPVGPAEVAIGEVGWAVLRGVVYAVAFTLVMTALGLVHSPWAVFAVPGAVLISFAVAAVGVACTTYMKSWQDFDYVLLIAVPMFLFSGTFFPVTRLPGWLQPLAYATPLWHGVALCRGLSLGILDAGSAAIHVAYLGTLTAAGLWAGAKTYRRRLYV